MMNNVDRLTKLVLKGEWNFKSDGQHFTRKGLSVKARANLMLQLLSSSMRRPVSFAVPYCLAVEPASICNLQCPSCPAGVKRVLRSPSLLELANFKRTIDMIGDYLTHIQLWSWGEPFINRNIYEMIEYAKKKNIIVVSSTNCHYLTDEKDLVRLVHSGLDELILAVDGTTQEVYQKYRKGGNLDKALEGIRNLVGIKKREGVKAPRLHMRMVINPFNEDQRDEFIALARGLGVDVVSFKKIDTGMGGLDADNCLLPKNKDYALNFTSDHDKYRCYTFWNCPVLCSNGDIGMCSLDSENITDIGNITDIKSFKKAWNSARARACRRDLIKDADHFQFCRECTKREPEAKDNDYFDVTYFDEEQLLV